MALLKKKIERIIYSLNEDKIINKNVKKEKDKSKNKLKEVSIYNKEKRIKNYKKHIKSKKPILDNKKGKTIKKINIKKNKVNEKIINLPHIDEEVNN